MSKSLSLFAILMVLAMAVGSLSACGDPFRDDCKSACKKMLDCDDEDNGGSGALNIDWLYSCQNSCDEADEIDDTMAKCIIAAECENMASECGTGSM